MNDDTLKDETQGSFLEDIKDFNLSFKDAMDSASTAGDKEAQRGVLEKMFVPGLPKIGKRVQELALFSDSDATSLNACKTIIAFLFESKAGDEDAFSKLMGDLVKNDKPEAVKENTSTST